MAPPERGEKRKSSDDSIYAKAPAVRVTWRRAATQKRSQAASLRQSAHIRSGKPLQGLLRRKVVAETSRLAYQSAVDEFHAVYNLSLGSALSLIDEHLDSELVRLFLSAESPGVGKILYYGVLWAHCLVFVFTEAS